MRDVFLNTVIGSLSRPTESVMVPWSNHLHASFITHCQPHSTTYEKYTSNGPRVRIKIQGQGSDKLSGSFREKRERGACSKPLSKLSRKKVYLWSFAVCLVGFLSDNVQFLFLFLFREHFWSLYLDNGFQRVGILYVIL